MRGWGWLAPAILLSTFALEVLAGEEPPLPTWDVGSSASAGTAADMTPGSNFSNLLPKNDTQDPASGFFLGDGGSLASPPLMLDDSGLSPHDLALFLRGGLLDAPQEPVRQNPTPAVALREVPEVVLEALPQVPLNEYLINPQSLMTELPALDLERLLQFHASEARILLYVLVLDRDQTISDAARLNDLAGRLLAGREICLVVYPLGEPWRARFMVSQGVQQSASVAGLSEMAEDCIQDALLTNDPDHQLQRFAVKLSTRLFWLEKNLTKAVPVMKRGAVFHEVTRKPLMAAAVHSGLSWPVLHMAAVSALSVMIGAGLILALRFWSRARALKKQLPVWMLPEIEVQPRLGGAFSGGAGAMIHFSSKGSPPAAK